MLAPESTFHDHYRITYVIDERPDCVIYRAIDLRESLRVLIAELPQPSEAAIDDVRLLAGQIATVSTPGLLALRDHFAQGTTYYLVADDPGGQDLDRVARDRGGPLPENEVLTLIDRLLGVLDVVHNRSPALLIGDLRATDLWSSPDGGLNLTPFGLVRHFSAEPSPYRAPELHDPNAEPTSASDLYALGAVLYQLLTGWAPPTAAQREAGTPLNAPRTLNARVSTLAEQLALRALESKPANRYQRAREMRSALETVRLMAGRPLGATPPLPTGPVETSQPLGPALVAAPVAVPVPGTPFGSPGSVAGPPPPASPFPPAPAPYAPPPQPQYASYAPAPATARPAPRISNGCLIGLVAALAVIALLICIAGAYVGYRVITGAGLPFVGGAMARSTAVPGVDPQATSAPTSVSETAGQAANPTAAPALAATASFTQTRQIEEDAVGAAAYSPTGARIAIGIGGNIQLRNGDELEQGPTLSGHSGEISALTFSPDGKILASGAQDENAIRLWDAEAGQQLRSLDGHTGWIRSLAFSPDGTMLASGSIDKTVRLWDVASGETLKVFSGHNDWLGNIAWSPDGTTLASASRDGTVRLWNVADGQQRAAFSYTAPQDPATNAPYWLTGLSYSPDGKQLAVGSVSGSIYVLDPASGKLQRELVGHAGWVVIRGVSFSPDGSILASASLDGTVRLWSPTTGSQRAVLEQRGLRLLGLSWNPDSQRLAVSSDIAGSLAIWNVRSREVERSLLLAQGAVTSLAYSDTGATLGSGGASGTVRIHLFADDREMTLNGGAPTNQYLGFISDTQLAAISDAGEVVIIDLTGADRNRQLTGLEGLALNLAVSRDRRLVAVGNERGDVVVWDASNQEQLQTLHGLAGPVFALSFNRDGSQLAAATNKNADAPEIVVWDVQSGAQKSQIKGQSGPLTSLDMPAGDGIVASASSDGSLKLWSAADGKEVGSISATAEQRWFSSFAFSPDGKTLVTGSLNGEVSFWDPQSGAQLNTINLGSGTVLALAFRPDGGQLAASTRDGGIYLLEPTG